MKYFVFSGHVHFCTASASSVLQPCLSHVYVVQGSLKPNSKHMVTSLPSCEREVEFKCVTPDLHVSLSSAGRLHVMPP